MKLLVISDTHRRIELATKLIASYQVTQGIEGVVHCGDHIDDANALAEKFGTLTFYSVPGNCDRAGYASGSTSVVTIQGVTTLIAHGHKHQVKYDISELRIDAQAYDAKLVLFGHTHCAMAHQEEGIWYVNPGSLSEPRDTMYPSFACVTIGPNQEISVEIYLVTEKGIVQKP